MLDNNDYSNINKDINEIIEILDIESLKEKNIENNEIKTKEKENKETYTNI